MEVGDMLALVDILIEQGVINQSNLDTAKLNKIEKLKVWSALYKD